VQSIPPLPPDTNKTQPDTRMKPPKSKLALAVLLLLPCWPVTAQLVIPSDGSDGVFAPTTDIVISLAEAVDGTWNVNNSANAGKGVYDADKWAVVFKYSSVNIPAGVTVRFLNHRSRAPVVWLVQGNVTIDGVLYHPPGPSDRAMTQASRRRRRAITPGARSSPPSACSVPVAGMMTP
jgi:plastocyanin